MTALASDTLCLKQAPTSDAGEGPPTACVWGGKLSLYTLKMPLKNVETLFCLYFQGCVEEGALLNALLICLVFVEIFTDRGTVKKWKVRLLSFLLPTLITL